MSEDISPQHAAGDTAQERLANLVSSERATEPMHEPTASAGTTKRKRWELTPARTRVIVAALGLIGVLAGVLIPRLLPQTSPSAPTNSVTPTTHPPAPTNSVTPTPGPPSASVVTVLMAEEAALSVAHRPADAVRLYVPTALVRDDACGNPSLSHTWYGQHKILLRYQQLGAFGWLKHQNAEVSFTPDTAQANSATVRAQTAGYIEPSATSAGQEIHGNEVWTFIRVNGKWLISSFTYNVCLALG